MAQNISKGRRKNLGGSSGERMRILIIGDFHIPDRAKEIPQWIREYIEGINWDLVLCTGDLTGKEVLEYLETLGEVFCVKGNMDWLDLPDYQIVPIFGKTLLLHSHQIRPRGDLEKLYNLAQRFRVNAVVFGHTHRPLVKKYKGLLFINPGTATGAWGGSYEGGDQSFVEVLNNCVILHKNEESSSFSFP